MMDYSLIKFLIEDNISIIVLNKPDSLNSINSLMGKEILMALKAVEENNSIHALVLTGEGKAFCAGQDLREIVNGTEIRNPFEIVRDIYNPIVRKIRYLNKPVVCAVNGVAAGAGANIALCCDIILCSSKAYFIQAFSKIGLIPDSGGTFILPRIVGHHRAAAMMMMNDKISADEGLKIGLVYKVFDEENLYNESLKITKQLASMPPAPFGLIKQALNASFSNDLESQLELEALLQQKAGETIEYKERVKAFIQKT